MSFFNLTALGSDNIFHQQKTFIHLFTAKDVQDSLERLGLDEVKKKEDLFLVLEDMYKGTLPPKDFEEWDAFADKKNIAFKDIENFLEDAVKSALAHDSQFKCSQDCQFSSFNEFKDAQKRHIRTIKSPNEVLEKPLISSQEYGWKSNECDGMTMYPREIHARKSCPETQYASHLYKSGIL